MNRAFASSAMLVILGCLVIFSGCQPPSESETVRRLAEKIVHEQAQQNLKVSEATESLVRADSEARLTMSEAHSDMIEAHNQMQLKLQAERGLLDQRRNDLDSLKDKIEYERRSAPVIAESVQLVGGILACLCPLLLAGFVLHSMNKTIDSDQEKIVNQFLIQELTRKTPLLLPSLPESNAQGIEDQRQLMTSIESESDSDEEPPF